MDYLQYFALSFFGSIAPAIVINIEKRILIWAGLGGSLGFLVAYAFNPGTTSFTISQIFIGTVVVGIYSELMARRMKAPTTVFLVPGIFPLVPGVTAYQTIQAAAQNRIQEATALGIETITKAFTIAFSMMLVTALFRFVKRSFKKEQCKT